MNDRGLSALAAAFERGAAGGGAQSGARPGARPKGARAVDAARVVDAARSPASPGEVGLIGRPTPQRTEVLQALAGCEEFISAQLLHASLLAVGSRVGLSTVYRTLTALAAAGLADVVRDVNGEKLFCYRPDEDHRHYLICRRCGISVPVDAGPVESWADEIARTSGFAQVQHTVELAGTCADCVVEEADG
ncbi:Fur family transcriptional regulator [Kitasatospora kifunensis]|uniref:Fur family ferric uptake transcriptional regulator n=1 Tax=Kitasatospora kifunensis TaxID=58351 RepID=A0A7W7R9L7_KITKI|nr:Fur family transcriptional regulator [Kitasatospora kifunensis]MBB4927623.1 Fur family ferric uptake transcriptional regulator [Kitasatospora kifunensis]